MATLLLTDDAAAMSLGLQFGGGVCNIVVYSATNSTPGGGHRPNDPTGAAAGSSAILGTLICNSGFGTAAAGVITINNSPVVSTAGPGHAVLGGSATWFRILNENGTGIIDGSITATGGGGDITMPNIVVTAGLPIQLTNVNTLTIGG